MSAKNTHDIEILRNYLRNYKEKHVYLVGVQNSGKTTLFKALTHHTKALAFKKAGLTQEALTGQLNHQTIYDMPGLYQEGYLHQILPYEIYKNLIPDEQIRPKIYQLRQNQTLFIEGLIAFTSLGDERTVALYVERNVSIHKTNQLRIKPLLLEKEKHFKIFANEYQEKAFKIPEGKQQITLADMGFIHITGPLTVKLTYPKDMHLSITEALFQ
jgi:ribosome biogenesis GTPase A